MKRHQKLCSCVTSLCQRESKVKKMCSEFVTDKEKLHFILCAVKNVSFRNVFRFQHKPIFILADVWCISRHFSWDDSDIWTFRVTLQRGCVFLVAQSSASAPTVLWLGFSFSFISLFIIFCQVPDLLAVSLVLMAGSAALGSDSVLGDICSLLSGFYCAFDEQRVLCLLPLDIEFIWLSSILPYIIVLWFLLPLKEMECINCIIWTATEVKLQACLSQPYAFVFSEDRRADSSLLQSCFNACNASRFRGLLFVREEITFKVIESALIFSNKTYGTTALKCI